MEVEGPTFVESVVETVGDSVEDCEDAVALGFALCVVPSFIKTP